MKGLNIFTKHKLAWIITLCVIFVLLLVFFIIFFIVPSFGDNTYGHRLDDIEKYKIKSSVIDDIEDSLEGSEGVTKVTYNREGRILNFTIKVEGIDLNKAKEYANLIPTKISKKNLKYYDIQIFLDSKDNQNDFPIAGYKHKTSDVIVWGNVGGASE